VETKELSEKNSEKDKIKKQIKSYLENQIGFPLKYEATIPPLTEGQWRLKGKVEQMSKSARELLRISLGEETISLVVSESKGEKEASFVEKTITGAPKGDFGPEIQNAKVALAAFFWRKGNQKKTQQLLFEAQLLHPQGIVTTPVDSELPLSEEFEAIVAGEKMVSKRKSCLLDLGLGEEGATIWANGFLINPQEKKIQEGIYHFVLQNKQGYFSEKFIRCNGKVSEDKQWIWSEHIPGHRIDRYFSKYFSGFAKTIVLESEKGKIRGFLFSKKKGTFSLGDGFLRWGDSFQMENAHILSLWKKVLLEKEQSYSLPAAPSERLIEEKWYNKKWVWTLIGGAIAGSVLLQEVQKSGRSPVQEGQILFQSD
jgi:hypothetical protein